jgi:hypothetical protein
MASDHFLYTLTRSLLNKIQVKVIYIYSMQRPGSQPLFQKKNIVTIVASMGYFESVLVKIAFISNETNVC